MSKNQMLDAIVDIYSAPGNVAGWEHALDTITTLVGGRTSGFVFVNNLTGFVEFTISRGYSAEIMSTYAGEEDAAVNGDVRYKYRHNLLPGKVFRELEYIKSQYDLETMPWNVYEREKLGLYYGMAALISTHGVWSDYISVNRLESKGPNTDAEKHNLQQLLPHLSKAGEVHRLVDRLQEQFGLVLSVLDRLMIGVVIIDRLGRVAAANTSASESAANTGAFRITAGRLKIFDPVTASRFSQILQRAVGTATGQDDNPGGCIVINSRAENHQVVLEVLPLRDDGFSDGDNIKGAVVFILDPTIDYPFSMSALRKIFNLTTSESQIAEMLVNGVPVNQIAEQRDTQPDTVRGQLKSIYQKTETSSQLDLLRKVIKASPPIKPD